MGHLLVPWTLARKDGWAALSSFWGRLQDSEPGLFPKHKIASELQVLGMPTRQGGRMRQGGRATPSSSWSSPTAQPPQVLVELGLLWSTYHGVAQKEDGNSWVVFLHKIHML